MNNIQQAVAIRRARFYAPIGYYEEEQLLGNECYLDVEAWFPFTPEDTEALENTLNYEELYRLLTKVMSKKRKLLESAAAEILEVLTKEHPQISKASVTIQKTNPPFGGDSSLSEVTLLYKKDTP